MSDYTRYTIALLTLAMESVAKEMLDFQDRCTSYWREPEYIAMKARRDAILAEAQRRDKEMRDASE